MANCYSNLAQIKRRLDITSTSNDTSLLELLNAASRAIDNYTMRFFYVLSATTTIPRYYDGSASPWMIPDDVLAITTLKTDEDGDATFENSYTETTDYHLYPLNEYPKTWAKINSNGSYGGFASGTVRGIELIGTLGYGDGESATPYVTSGATVTVATTTGTSVTASDGTAFAVGQTILAGTEQMYISAISSNTLTCTRGVNGTTAAIQAAATAYIYDYPEPIVEATLIQAMRWWKRRESAFQDMVGSPEVGQLIAYKGMDADLKLIVKGYFKVRST